MTPNLGTWLKMKKKKNKKNKNKVVKKDGIARVIRWCDNILAT